MRISPRQSTLIISMFQTSRIRSSQRNEASISPVMEADQPALQRQWLD
jgi:hypothetical protein